MQKTGLFQTLLYLAIILFLLGCVPVPAQNLAPTLAPTLPAPTQAPSSTTAPTPTLPEAATPTIEPSPAPTDTPTETPAPTEPALEADIATVQNDALLITHVSSGKPGEPRKLAQSDIHGGLFKIGWSPTGEYIAWMMDVHVEPHLLVANIKEYSDPIDLGWINEFAWSPDGKTLAYEKAYEM